jgi:hypothetical protein
MVLAGVAAFTRVCANDRPGTAALINGNVRQSRSGPVRMPRTTQDVVADLHALLRAAGVPGSYVFAGHSCRRVATRHDKRVANYWRSCSWHLSVLRTDIIRRSRMTSARCTPY